MPAFPRPRTSAALLLSLWCVACLAKTEPDGLRYTVARGDTLSAIASKHGVSVQDIRTWNALESDAIDVDQVLILHTGEVVQRKGPSTKRTPRAVAVPTPASETFTLPPAQPCVPPPTVAEGDEFVTVGSQGLSRSQASAALKPFVPRTTSCTPDAWLGNGTLQLDLTVACTGRVASVEVVSDGGLPDELVSCVADRMRYVPFPAHALPDGDVVRYPITYSSR